MPGRSRNAQYTVLPAASAHAPVVHELEIRRSRFIGCLARVETEQQAREFIAGLRRQHHEARHVCSAFILGPDRDVMRSSDDGEPAGTAGIPMLEALSMRDTGGARDLSDVCAVVVRYFGGVKLGAGGLVRAYSDAVSAVLDTAPLLARQRMVLAGVEAPHAEAGRWENELRAAGFAVQDTDYGASSATVTVALPDDGHSTEAFAARLASITAGAGTFRTLGSEWVDLP
ncbi:MULTISPECIES: IMPACT family protein [Citricoccus]|uniref:IMPACT family protein n=1 Tax=Citricoccus TaxID=169133 RepID=UPI000255EBC3|nr:YigZ family protein [Citricoccus sp. CH26A]